MLYSQIFDCITGNDDIIVSYSKMVDSLSRAAATTDDDHRPQWGQLGGRLVGVRQHPAVRRRTAGGSRDGKRSRLDGVRLQSVHQGIHLSIHLISRPVHRVRG